MAKRVAYAYRAISSVVVFVIAGLIATCTTLAEDVECFQRRGIETQGEWSGRTRFLSSSNALVSEYSES